jgi:hypothetical protein
VSKSSLFSCTPVSSTHLVLGRNAGSTGEHVQTLYSDDSGASWSDAVSVEPRPINTELANAYSLIIAAPGMAADGGERLYTLYNMNLHNITHFLPTG